MPPLLELMVWLVVLGVIGLVVVGIRRMGGVRGSRSGVSSGVANWLADINAMLQPQQPTAEVLAQAQEQGEEDEGEGDDEDPEALGPRPSRRDAPQRDDRDPEALGPPPRPQPQPSQQGSDREPQRDA